MDGNIISNIICGSVSWEERKWICWYITSLSIVFECSTAAMCFLKVKFIVSTIVCEERIRKSKSTGSSVTVVIHSSTSIFRHTRNETRRRDRRTRATISHQSSTKASMTINKSTERNWWRFTVVICKNASTKVLSRTFNESSWCNSKCRGRIDIYSTTTILIITRNSVTAILEWRLLYQERSARSKWDCTTIIRGSETFKRTGLEYWSGWRRTIALSECTVFVGLRSTFSVRSKRRRNRIVIFSLTFSEWRIRRFERKNYYFILKLNRISELIEDVMVGL